MKMAIQVFKAVEVDSSKILAVFPVVSKTRQYVFRPLLNELAKRGHEIILVTPFPDVKSISSNITEFNNKDVALGVDKINLVNNEFNSEIQQLVMTFIKQIKSPVVSNALRRSTFDILIADADVRSILILSYIYDIPVIQISMSGATFNNFEIIGAPNNHFIYSSSQKQNPTFWETVADIYSYNSKEIAYNSFEKVENELLKKNFGSNIPDLSELYNSVHMLFVNVHSVWDENRPVPSSVLYLGGLHLRAENPLPPDLKNYLDSSANGVIFMSFGSIIRISHLQTDIVKAMIKVLSELPYDVIIKADTEELFELPSNIKTVPWIPQQDFLKHPKIVLFITQGGLQSTYEAIDSLVPLICIPIIKDQWYNSAKVVEHKIGLKLEIEYLTEESFRSTINKVIGNTSYRENLVKVRTTLQDQSQTPLKRAVWWIEYVLRHSGARHLRAPAANITWHQYLELELVAYLILTTTVFVTTLVTTMCFCFKTVFKTRSKCKLP